MFLVYFFPKKNLDSTIIFRKNGIHKEFQFHNSFHETWNIASGTPVHHGLSVRMMTGVTLIYFTVRSNFVIGLLHYNV